MKNKELFDYAIDSFAFVLPFNGEFEMAFWADEIAEIYDERDLRVSAVVEEIRKHEGKVYRRNGVTSVLLN